MINSSTRPSVTTRIIVSRRSRGRRGYPSPASSPISKAAWPAPGDRITIWWIVTSRRIRSIWMRCTCPPPAFLGPLRKMSSRVGRSWIMVLRWAAAGSASRKLRNSWGWRVPGGWSRITCRRVTTTNCPSNLESQNHQNLSRNSRFREYWASIHRDLWEDSNDIIEAEITWYQIWINQKNKN